MAAVESYHRDYRLLPAILDRKAKEDPNGVYACLPLSENLADGFRDYTYQDVLHAVDALALWLEATIGHSDSFETLSYVGVSDLRYVIFFQACIKAGYKSLFFSPKNTVPQNFALLQSTDCFRLYFSNEYQGLADELRSQTKLRGLEIVHLDPIEAWISRYREAKPFTKSHSEAQFDPIVVFHSSGSTGPPKTIIQNHQFYINGHRFPPLPKGKNGNFYDLYRFEEKSFITASFPFYHLAGFTFICVAPLFYESCSVACGFPNRPATPEAILQMLQNRRIRLLNTPPSIVEGILRLSGAEQYLKQLDTIIYAGGPLAKWAGDSLSQHTNCVTNYGSTESGPVALLLPDRRNWQWMDFHPDINLKWELMYDNAYELVFERDDQADRFRGIGATILRSQSVFRSKDLFIPHPTQPGLWQFFGRNDDIIVLSSGLKYNPIPSEAIISAHPEISGTIITGTGLLEPVAVIERKSTNTGISDAELLESIWPTVKRANQQTERHGRVRRRKVVLVEPVTFVRTPKGSVNRQASVRLLQGRIDKCVSTKTLNGSTDGSNVVVKDHEDLLSLVRDCVLQESELNAIDDNADFSTLGINSVDASEISMAIRAGLAASFPYSLLDSFVRSDQVFRFPTVSGLAAALYNQIFLHDNKYSRPSHDVAHMLLQRHRIQVSLSGQVATGRLRESSIAVSGTTGSLGSCLLRTLAHNHRWDKIVCLNRSVGAEQRTRLLLRSLPNDLWSKVDFIHMDQNADRLGISDAGVARLQQCQAIVHCAWQVNFLHSLESFELQIRDLKILAEITMTEDRSPRLFFASSISAVSRHLSTKIEERAYEDIDDAAATGYGQSKHVAERLLADASARHNLPVTILRIGQIAGYDPEFGSESALPRDDLPRWNPDEWFPSIFRTSQTLGAVPQEFGMIDWIPINVLSQAITELIVHDMSVEGFHVYNLVNPQRSPWSIIFEPVRKSMSAPLDIIPLADWVELLKKHNNGEELDVVGLPALKLLSFMESRLVTSGKSLEYSVGKVVQASQTMAAMSAINQEQVLFWTQQWKSG